MITRTYYKRQLMLREDAEKNYAASTDGTNSSASDIVNKTKQEHSDADSVTIPGKEIDGSSSTQVATMNVNNTPQELQNAQKMARTLQSQGQDVNFKVNLRNSYERNGNIVEGVTFTKNELREFLREI